MNTTMTLANAAASALLHSLWQLSLLALLAALSLAGLQRASARTRHAVAMGWLLAMAAAPAITFATCWHALEAESRPGATWFLAVTHAEDAAAAPVGALAGGWSHWMPACMATLWLLGAVLMVVRQVGGWRTLQRIEQAPSAALPPVWQARFDVLQQALGVTRVVRVRLAERVASPFTAHVLRPLVWLPLSLLTQLPRDQVEALLAHELAHIRRLDWCWNTMQCAVEAVLFHHPAMWWLSRRVREEREHACDDLAVAVCGDPVVLAQALAGLQGRGRPVGPPRLALAAQGGFLVRRIRHLLSSTPPRPDWRWLGVLLLLLCTGTLLAMQGVPPAGILVNLHADASSQGELTPGNFREFTASYLGARHRHYRIEMDAAGQVRETYTEDGAPAPIDAAARAWLHSVATMADGLPDGAPTRPRDRPAPPVRPPAPTPPAPPAPPAPIDSTEFHLLMQQLQSDPQVLARTGQPAALIRSSFHGRMHVWGARDFHLWGIDDPVGGSADFSATFAGPQGRVEVAWSGKTLHGAWTADSMTLSPAPH
jgi:beta-lactamase regulating signal transducer with metallopeptidase domain